LSKVTVTSRSFYVEGSMCPSCCWKAHSYNVLLQKSSCFQLLFLT